MSELVVSEIFGPTFQGEGPSLGRRAAFLRLGNCNLNCCWCDTKFTWDWDQFDKSIELTPLDAEEVIRRIGAMGVDLVVITGGEPLLQQRQLEFLMKELRRLGIRIEVETNGTILPSKETMLLVDAFNVSPKLKGSGVDEDKRTRPAAIRGLRDSGKDTWKFVVADKDDLVEVSAFVERFGVRPVYIMPEGVDWTAHIALTRKLVDEILARGFNLTTRLHLAIWGPERGH